MTRFLRDTEHGPISLSKLLCFVFAAIIGYDMVCHTIGPSNLAAFGLDMAAAFGRAMFGKWLDHNTWTSAVTANTTTTIDAAKVIEAVTARRDHARGAEPT